jgi:hypothetical protein
MGMIPMRYNGPLHCFGLIEREEGIRGLYRGYIPFLMATAIFFGVIPTVTGLHMMYDPIFGHGKKDESP